MRRGERVAGYLGRHAARVTGPGGRGGVVSSTLPLTVRGASGRLGAVDLSLVRRGATLTPRWPLVDTTISSRLGLGVRLDDVAVNVTPTGIRRRTVADLADGRAFYANAQTDTDWVFEPVPEGVQTFAVLRSPASPERLGLRLGGRAGTAVRRSRDPLGGFEILRRGRVLARFPPPVAWDAKREPVQVDARLDGNVLRMRVNHRRSQATYPITVDPPVVEDFRYWDDGAVDFNGWRPVTNDPAKYKFTAGSAYLGRGLYVYTRSSFTYTPDDYGLWAFDARGHGAAYIYRAEYHRLHHDNYHAPTSLFTGIFNPGATGGRLVPRLSAGWQGNSPISTSANFYDRVNNTRANLHCVNSGAGMCPSNGLDRPRNATTARGNVAVFGNWPDSTGLRSNFTDFTGGAAIYQTDDVIPARTSDTIPDGWVRSVQGATATFTDGGLGMRRLTAGLKPRRTWSHTAGQAATDTKTTAACTDDASATRERAPGNRNNPCPKDLQVALDSGDLPNGSHTVELTGTDAVGDTAVDESQRLKLDTEGPLLRLSGLVATERFVAPGAELAIVATDGSAATPGTSRSGAKRIDVLVDGAVVEPQPDTPCPASSCELSRSYRLNVPEGEHTVQVKAYDQIDNVRPSEVLRVVVDDAAPVPVNTQPPILTEPANATAVGDEIETSDGTWDNLQAGHSFEYQWLSCDATGASCAPIVGATAKKYRVTPDQVDRTLRARVTAINPGTTGQAASRRDATSAPSRRITPDVVDPVLLDVKHEPPVPTDWVDDHRGKVTGTATDVGLGLKRLDLTEPLTTGDKIRSARFQTVLGGVDCDGTAQRMCPPAGSKSFSYSTGAVRTGENPSLYREGYVTPKLEAVDGGERRSTPPAAWTLRVDRSAPTITPRTGSTMSPRDTLSVFDGKAITIAGVYTLSVATADGVRGGTPAQQRSGVATVEMQVSKNEGAFVSQGVRSDACTGDSCPGPVASYTVDTAQFGEGLHAIRVIAKDRLYDKVPDALKPRHLRERVFRFYVDLEVPTLGAIGHAPALPEGWVNRLPMTTTADAVDRSTGVRRLVLRGPGPAGAFERTSDVRNGANPCDLSVDALRRCPQTATGLSIGYDAADLREGRNVPVTLEAQDAVGRKSAAATWTLNVDRTAPAIPSNLAVRAARDPWAAGAIVTFAEAEDPALADGSAGSGTGYYKVRYRTNGGEWREEEIPEPRLVVPGAVVGDSIQVEVIAFDYADNPSAVVEGAAAVDTSCDDPAASEVAPCDSEPVDPDADPNETPADVEEEPETGGSGLRSFPAARLRLKVGKDPDGWATIRNRPNSLVIGNGQAGWRFNQTVGRDYEDRIGADGTVIGWRPGSIGSEFFFNCGWLQFIRRTGNTDNRTTNECAPTPGSYKRDDQIAAGYNCYYCGGLTRIKVLRPTPMYANVSPHPSEGVPRNPNNLLRTISSEDIDGGGYCVGWRYTTKGGPGQRGDFVLVRDVGPVGGDKGRCGGNRNQMRPAREDSTAGVWVFIRRDALQENLCENTVFTSPRRGCGRNETTPRDNPR